MSGPGRDAARGAALRADFFLALDVREWVFDRPVDRPVGEDPRRRGGADVRDAMPGA